MLVEKLDFVQFFRNNDRWLLLRLRRLLLTEWFFARWLLFRERIRRSPLLVIFLFEYNDLLELLNLLVELTDLFFEFIDIFFLLHDIPVH